MNNKIAPGQLWSSTEHGNPVSYFTSSACDGIMGFVWMCILALLIHHCNYWKPTDIPCSLEPTVTDSLLILLLIAESEGLVSQQNSDPTNY